MASYSIGKVKIVDRGAYSSSVAYTPLDAVTNLGGTWLCKSGNTGVEPGVTSGWATYWTLMANGINSITVTPVTTGVAQLNITMSSNDVVTKTVNVAQQPLPLKYQNVSVLTSAWAADTTYSDYPNRATIPLVDGNDNSPNVNCYPTVTLSVADASSGNFAPTAATYDGGVYIYAATAPTAAMTIPSIVCMRWSYDGNT